VHIFTKQSIKMHNCDICDEWGVVGDNLDIRPDNPLITYREADTDEEESDSEYLFCDIESGKPKSPCKEKHSKFNAIVITILIFVFIQIFIFFIQISYQIFLLVVEYHEIMLILLMGVIVYGILKFDWHLSFIKLYKSLIRKFYKHRKTIKKYKDRISGSFQTITEIKERPLQKCFSLAKTFVRSFF